METRVTALVVAHRDADHLRRTLESLAAQTRRPDTVIAVAFDATDDVLRLLEKHAPDQIVTAKENLTFGQALAAGERVAATPSSESDYLWLLAQDTAPAPDALHQLLGRFENSPSAAVAGPKLVDWNDSSRLRGIGETMTTGGATVALVEDQLDQGQHDTVSDVLAVGAAGMLVRHVTWQSLDGFDPALGPVDDGLDFCVRTRLAGRRVVLAADAVVAVAGDGIAGVPRSRRWAAKQRKARYTRTAELHRRLVYARPFAVLFHWLSLVPLAIIRSVLLLVRKQPELIGAEFRAAFWVAFGGTHVLAARRRLARGKSVGWSVLSDLRMTRREVRRRRRLDRDENAAPVAPVERSDLRFLTGGGGWVVLASAVAGAIMFIRLLPAETLAGGGLLPLSPNVGALWQNLGYGWRSIGEGFVGAADPFSAVLAALGTITFWQPSYALVLLWVLALPLATLTAWFAATRLTERSGYRILGAVAWTLSPTFLIALVDGRPAAVLAHILLPGLFYAGAVAARSWAAAASCGILLAAVGACAPILLPALAVLWIIAIAVAGLRFARVLFIPLPLIALFAPLAWQQGIVNGNWLSILADPGRPLASPASTPSALLLGIPGTGLGGWSDAARLLNLPELALTIGLPVLLAPLVIVGIAGLFLSGWQRPLTLWAVALLGFATAVASGQLAVTFIGATATTVWPGTGLSLMWLGLVGAGVAGLDSLRARGAVPAAVAGITLAALAAPAFLAAPLGASPVRASDGRTLPAYVTAAAETDAGLGTLRVSPQADGSVVSTVVRGTGEHLDTQSTLVTTGAVLGDPDGGLAQLTGNIISVTGEKLTPELRARGVGFVLLAPTPEAKDGEPEEAALATAKRASAALDANPELENVGETDTGMLWRTVDTVKGSEAGSYDSFGSLVSLAILVLVFAVALLIAIPTSASRETARMTPRTVGRRDEPETHVEPEPEDEEVSLLVDPEAEAEPEWADIVSLPGSAPAPAPAPALVGGGTDAHETTEGERHE
ncbi:Glycosyltransferase, GT2 family [Paramicrobacterium humi]|uniref:Glycosyltransferase, GT2 family n=1 Tax=Paramicrobacterium humi TaxID=640635 RepID=A0A1H4P1F3_9MICO|nr:glycosyltransferase family 2 protein [Microbacterium humi]SEC01174.1 Glycosyltransferase, GT2 family [Microbacterium humi]